jgi:hypothetical protein
MKIIINQGREILLLGSVRESIMTASETSSEKNSILYFIHDYCHFHFLYPFLVRFFNTKYKNIEKSTHTNNNVDRFESNLFCFKSYFDL